MSIRVWTIDEGDGYLVRGTTDVQQARRPDAAGHAQHRQARPGPCAYPDHKEDPMKDGLTLLADATLTGAAHLAYTASRRLVGWATRLEALAYRLDVLAGQMDQEIDPELVDDMATIIALSDKRPRTLPGYAEGGVLPLTCCSGTHGHHPSCPLANGYF